MVADKGGGGENENFVEPIETWRLGQPLCPISTTSFEQCLLIAALTVGYFTGLRLFWLRNTGLYNRNVNLGALKCLLHQDEKQLSMAQIIFICLHAYPSLYYFFLPSDRAS